MSVFALRRILLPHPYRLQVLRLQTRQLHVSAPALKKKKKSAYSEDDHFEFNLEETLAEDDLFGSLSKKKGEEVVVSETPREEETKRELFETLRTKTLAKLNLRGRMGQPPRRSTVTLLTGLSETKEDLEKALEVIAAWRTVAMPPDSKTADDFIGRCIHLRHPEIALEVVVNRPKYGMDMPSLNTARRLLQGLSQAREGYNEEQILNECLALAEVYPVYGFPPATQDVVSCSILAKVLFRRIKDNRIRKDQGSEELTQAWCAIVAELKSAIKSWKAQAPSVSNTEERQLWADLEFIKGKLNHNNMSGDNGTWIREFQSKLHTSKRGV